MPDTFVKIATVTVGAGGAATMAFSSIPSTYTDLQLNISARNDFGSSIWDNILVTFNSDTGSNYSMRRVSGDGSSATSASQSSVANIAFRYATTSATATSSTFANSYLYIPNYAGSSQKSISGDAVIENNATAGGDNLMAGLWTGTAAINAITLTGSNGSFVQYSTATLYGISKS